MSVNKKVFQTVYNSQKSTNSARSYEGSSIVLRESIFSLSLRIFFVELFIGLIGLGLRIPILFLLNTLETGFYSYIFYVVIYLVFQIVNVSVLIWLILGWYNKSYILRKNDMLIRYGVVNSQEKLLQYDNMERITINQGLLGKIFNYGAIDIFNPLLKENTYLHNISDPRKYAQIIQGIVPKTVDDNQRIIVRN